MDNYQSVSG